MAPEVALGRPYNEKCDVFSFGVLLFEIISLRPPFSLTITENYLKFVAKGRKRPCIKMRWPSMTKLIMKDSWMADSCKRPSMGSICNMIKVDLQELETEENITLRIKYIENISEHSSK
jgi:Protein tyrosine and serine/threonine kinase